MWGFYRYLGWTHCLLKNLNGSTRSMTGAIAALCFEDQIPFSSPLEKKVITGGYPMDQEPPVSSSHQFIDRRSQSISSLRGAAPTMNRHSEHTETVMKRDEQVRFAVATSFYSAIPNQEVKYRKLKRCHAGIWF